MENIQIKYMTLYRKFPNRSCSTWGTAHIRIQGKHQEIDQPLSLVAKTALLYTSSSFT